MTYDIVINGYKFNTEEQAINSIIACNQYYGIPKTPNDVTQNWTEYYTTNLNNPQFWYIIFDNSLLPILGQPIDFEVTKEI